MALKDNKGRARGTVDAVKFGTVLNSSTPFPRLPDVLPEDAILRGAPAEDESGTIYDVAREAGVSIATVSKVFNDRPDVSRRTRRMVLDAARKVHYAPVMSSRRMSVGLLVEDLNRINEVGFVSQIVLSIAQKVTQHGGVLELVSLNDLDAILKNHVSGVIAVVFGTYDKLRTLTNLPVVLVNNELDMPNVHTVATDHFHGAHIATQHLLKCGHERVGFLEILQDAWGSRERQRGFMQAMGEAGRPADGWMRFTCRQPLRQAVRELLDQKATALLVCGEDLSLQINHLLVQDFNLAIPRDISVVSYEVPYVSSILSPPQTTVSQPWSELGSLAVEVLADVLAHPPAQRVHRMLPNRLLIRQSVRDYANCEGTP